MVAVKEYTLWMLFVLLASSSAVWLWTAIRRYHKNREEKNQLLKRIHFTLGDHPNRRESINRSQLADRLKKLTEEANELLHHLVEKQESGTKDKEEEHPPEE